MFQQQKPAQSHSLGNSALSAQMVTRPSVALDEERAKAREIETSRRALGKDLGVRDAGGNMPAVARARSAANRATLYLL